VRVASTDDLALLTVRSLGAGVIEALDVRIDSWSAPGGAWLGAPGLGGVKEASVTPGRGGLDIRLVAREALDAGTLLAAALRCARPAPTGDVGPRLGFAAGLPDSAAGVASRIRDLVTDPRDAHLRRCDTLLTPDPALPVERHRTVVLTETSWRRDDAEVEVLIDPLVHRPFGRRSAGGTVARADASAAGVRIHGEGVDLALSGSVSSADVRALRRVRGVEVMGDLPAAMRVQLLAAGLVLLEPGEPHPQTDLDWLVRSVHERRHAHRSHGPRAGLDDWPSVSLLLATHRRDHLPEALRQVARMHYPRLEVVVGLHGEDMHDDEVRRAVLGLPHPARTVDIDRAATLGEAMQRLSTVADGSLVAKIDDDDVYGPEHVWDLVVARDYSGAQLVGKALDWVYLAAEDATLFRPTYPAEKYDDFVCGGTMLIAKSDLLDVGGWRPVPRSVDRGLLDDVLAGGGLVYRTHGLGYVYVRRPAGHTASVQDAHFHRGAVARHDGLIQHAAFGTAEEPA
jgi:hypothetical protein